MLTDQILLQLIVILIVVQLFGHACARLGQQWVIAEILAGLALGPSLLGAVAPALKAQLFPATALPTLQTLGDIGLVLYMFSLGARLDTHLMLRQSRHALAVSLSGMALPFALGAGLALALYPGLAGPQANQVSFVLLVGTAMAITAFPVLARLLVEKGMLGTRVGTLAMTCAAIADAAAWCLLALAVAIVHARGAASAAVTVGLTALFVGAMLAVVRPLLAYAVRRIPSRRVLIALGLVLLLIAAEATAVIGIHPVFGAFLMGVILPRRTLFVEYVRSLDQVNNGLFLPIFFVYSGLQTQIGLINDPAAWSICLLVLALACAGKVLGSTLPMRGLGEPWREALTLGVLMNTRGGVALIVLNIGLDAGVLSPTLFAMLVIMTLVTTMMASPLLLRLGYRHHDEPDASDDLPDVGHVPAVQL